MKAIKRSFSFINKQLHNKTKVLQINNPKQKNALSGEVLCELNSELQIADQDPQVSCLILTGNNEVFASGGSITEYLSYNSASAYKTNILSNFDYITQVRKPLIGAVNGWALGGGFQVALRCDILVAGENAKFGHPEMKIAATVGVGGSQLLPRIIGKYKAMDMILSTKQMTAQEALKAGLVSKVVAVEDTLTTAINLADKISQMSLPAVMMAKDSINYSFEAPLTEALNYEKKLFYLSFGFPDRKEGMSAFLEKRTPKFIN